MQNRRDWVMLATVVIAAVVLGLVSSFVFLAEFQAQASDAWKSGGFFGVCAGWAFDKDFSGWMNILAVTTGIVSVYLASRAVIWVWPVGIVWCLSTAYVMYDSRFFGDMLLMFVYFFLQIHGWYSWKKGGTNKDELPIRWASARVVVTLVLIVVALIYPAKLFLELDWVHGKAPLWDSFTTVGSLGAQYLLNRKYIQNWIGWLVVDLVYVPLYFVTGLYEMALLYFVFLILAVVGLVQWLRDFSAQPLQPSA